MKLLPVFTVLLLSALAALSDDDAAKKAVSPEAKEAAVQLIESRKVKEQMVAGMKQSLEGLPMDKALKKAMLTEFSKDENLDELKDLMAEVYAQHLSVEDLKAMQDFYATPAGKRIAAAETAISVDSMKAGQQWGARLGARVAEEMGKKKQEKDSEF